MIGDSEYMNVFGDFKSKSNWRNKNNSNKDNSNNSENDTNDIDNSSNLSNRKERFNNDVEARMMMDRSFAASWRNDINEERELKFCKGLSVEDVFEKGNVDC